jgi:hypothetical protein
MERWYYHVNKTTKYQLHKSNPRTKRYKLLGFRGNAYHGRDGVPVYGYKIMDKRTSNVIESRDMIKRVSEFPDILDSFRSSGYDKKLHILVYDQTKDIHIVMPFKDVVSIIHNEYLSRYPANTRAATIHT